MEQVRYLFAGIRLIVKDKSFWPYIWKPMLIGLAAYVAIVAIGFALVIPASAKAAEAFGAQGESMSWLRSISSGIGAILFAVMLWFVSGILYLAVTSVFSSFLWEKLSLKVDERIGAGSEIVRLGAPTLVVDSLIRVGLAVVAAAVSLVTGWFCLGVLGILAAGWLGLYDYTGPAYLRRGICIWWQYLDVFRLKGWMGFLVGSGLMTLLPFVNVALLPGLVAGGCMLRAQSTGELRVQD